MSRLAGCNVIAKDLEVYAAEMPPSDYSIAREVAGVERVANDAGFERFHLYGHSGGGAVALAYAAAHADRLLSLALDEPAYDFTDAMRADMEVVEPLKSLPAPERIRADRKSTRLNSSHSQISYAVFCLKKKNKKKNNQTK